MVPPGFAGEGAVLGGTVGRVRAVLVLVLAASASLVATPAAAEEPLGCGGEPATIIGTDGDDLLIGTPDRDVIHGRQGRDVIRGLEGNDIMVKPIFKFVQTGIDPDGRLEGQLEPTGHRPAFVNHLREAGLAIDDRLFEPRKKKVEVAI